MKRLATLVAMCVTCAALSATMMSGEAHAADKVRGNFGIGVGSSTSVGFGLSAKLYMGEGFSIQPVAGIDSDWIGLSVDALLEMPAIVDLGGLEIAWALGVGPGVGIGDDSIAIGIAGVAALEFNFSVIPGLPFDLVVEYRPNLFVVPNVNLDLVDFTGHVRVYF